MEIVPGPGCRAAKKNEMLHWKRVIAHRRREKRVGNETVAPKWPLERSLRRNTGKIPVARRIQWPIPDCRGSESKLRFESKDGEPCGLLQRQADAPLAELRRSNCRLVAPGGGSCIDPQRSLALESRFDRRIPGAESSAPRSDGDSPYLEWISVVAAEFLRGDAVPGRRGFHFVTGVAVVAVAGDAESRATRRPERKLSAPLEDIVGKPVAAPPRC